MSRLGTITRRGFLIAAAAIAGGVAVGYYYVRAPYPNPLEDDLDSGEATFNPYVKITADNAVTVIAPRAEMGQGVSTTLAALVAEELGVGLDDISVEHGPASYAYYNSAMLAEGGPFPLFDEGMIAQTMRGAMGAAGKVLGLQATGGSSSVRDGFERMRRAGAAARHMLTAAAANALGVSANELTIRGKSILHEVSGRSVTFGAVAAAAAEIDPPSQITLKEPGEWRLLGKPQPRVDMAAKVTGAPIFGIDVHLPEMLYGTVRMSPRFGARPIETDLSRAEAMPGVVAIVPIDTTYGHGFGVIAENTWAAFQAAAAIEVEWGPADYPADDAAIEAAFKQALASGAGDILRDDGDVDAAFADAPAERVIEADYAVPFLAHACMEPMNATARLSGGVLELWSPNQVPTLTRQLCADLAGVEIESVNVHTTHLGGGFGRRGEMGFSMYATLLARHADGRPVKVTWTREEDVAHDVYRPAARGRFRARLGEDGLPVALDMRIASPSIMASVLKRTFPSISPVGPDKSIVEGSFDQPYSIADYRVGAVETPLGIPVGFWRSVGNSYNGFFHECFLDEIATAAKLDPLAMRRTLMGEHPAALKVLDRLAEISNWSAPVPAGRAKGMAFTLSFGSWVAEAVEIAETGQGIRIDKVWIVADVGRALDPAIIEAQLVSGAVFGLSSAMNQEITFADGMTEQSNFHDFDAMRINQCPQFEIAILENYHRMGGVGEIATPPAVPALANAVFALTGKRVRRLPLSNAVEFV
ncbi:xanthine dehydrogenase family protein molybdopterin-binding subunit [Mesorhizobium xinjiangense]|uniref:xanthine dehydrogenase family protein molybdopterin-binding subunit n=1 Tax=Mesorhizobium xinjiangense TaxID=2678685 RepID=UPI0012EDACD5|nr:molybdopterin cofactor-binding domain-containing protein [Mesorhizobium xinjiangense]